MRLDLDTFGETQFSRELLRVGDNAKDMTPAFDAIHELLLETETKQFSTQGSAFSGGWKPLAPSTSWAKIKAGLDLRILHATLRLRDSLTQPNHPDHVYTASGDEMFVGSKVPYGKFHQTGTERMPRRRPFQFDDSTRKQIVKLLQRHLLDRDGLE